MTNNNLGGRKMFPFYDSIKYKYFCRNRKRVFYICVNYGIKVISIFLILHLMLLTVGCTKQEEQENKSSNFILKSIPVEVNDEWVSSDCILFDSESNVTYFPIKDLTNYLGIDYEKYEDGKACIDGKIDLKVDGDSVIDFNGKYYVSEQFLKNILEINVYQNDDGVYYIDNYPVLDYSWTKYRTVTHACGGIDGMSYTNSYDALELNYNQGCKLFEIDFCLTADNEPVCAHDWPWTYSVMNIPLVEREKQLEEITNDTTSGEQEIELEAPPLTLAEFKSQKIYEKYTPMSFEELVVFMQNHEDMYVITDTKNVRDPEVSDMFNSFVRVAEKHDISVLDRIIPQIYNNEMYDIIKEIYDWKSVIYTFYNQGGEFRYRNVYDYSRKNGIKVFTTYETRNDLIFIDAMTDRGAVFYMHTYNTMEDVLRIMDAWKIYGVYTDYLPPDCLDQIPYPYVKDASEE